MPPLEIGRLDDRVTVQTLVETVDQFGQAVQSWTSGVTCWARVRPPTGRESVNADQLKAELSQVVTMLYRSNIDVTQQLLWGAKVLRITYIKPDEMRQTMDLYCVEQVGSS
jgi:SPP1 family predicted phage head-tail adaptor